MMLRSSREARSRPIPRCTKKSMPAATDALKRFFASSSEVDDKKGSDCDVSSSMRGVPLQVLAFDLVRAVISLSLEVVMVVQRYGSKGLLLATTRTKLKLFFRILGCWPWARKVPTLDRTYPKWFSRVNNSRRFPPSSPRRLSSTTYWVLKKINPKTIPTVSDVTSVQRGALSLALIPLRPQRYKHTFCWWVRSCRGVP